MELVHVIRRIDTVCRAERAEHLQRQLQVDDINHLIAVDSYLSAGDAHNEGIPLAAARMTEDRRFKILIKRIIGGSAVCIEAIIKKGLSGHDRSKLHNFWSLPERTERCRCILHTKHLRVAVVLVVHPAQIRVRIQHRLLRFESVILDQLAGNADPRAFRECADLRLGICGKLMAGRLDLAGLDVEFSLKLIDRTERADSRLIALYRCQIVNLRLFQKIIYSFHNHSPLSFVFIIHARYTA